MTRYELLDRIGVGGMAEIFRGKAVAAGGFEKPVAIKRILPHLSQDRRFVELLIAEAKVLSLLKHRNIVQIFDVGLGDDGKYFLVMEYVDGKDLRAVQTGLEVRRRRMPFDLALHIGAEICEALEHAHSARAPDGKPMSLVHRDVSPSNVLLSRAGEIKLTDFGIAKRAEQETTGHGAVRGKFAYISPEQARNESIDPRSDVFSVGILLWELIVNRRLFSGLGDLEALRAVRDAQVPRPSEIDSRLQPEIDQLLLSALARDVKARPTAGQLGAKLRSLRYSLEITVGDPATELAKIIETADEVERQSKQMLRQQLPSGGFDQIELSEATVIRIRTADEFQLRDKDGAGVAKAREVIDRFEEDETRQAHLSGDQMRILRAERRDSDSRISPPELPGLPRSQRSMDEDATTARGPLPMGDSNTSFDFDESTRLLAPRDRRMPGLAEVPLRGTPGLERVPATGSPMPPRSRPGSNTESPPGSSRSMQPLDPRIGSSEPVSADSWAPPSSPAPVPQQPILGMQSLPQRPIQQPPILQPEPPPMVSMPPPMQGNYPGWGAQPQQPQQGAPLIGPDMYERPVYPQNRPSAPQVAGFGSLQQKPFLRPWMLVVGAILMAGLAFAITRVFLSS